MGILKDYEDFVRETGTVRNDAYAGLGLSGESGEVFDEVALLRQAARANESFKKVIRNGAEATALRSELGDVLWYTTKIALQYNMTLRDVIECNVEKLTERRKNGKKTG